LRKKAESPNEEGNELRSEQLPAGFVIFLLVKTARLIFPKCCSEHRPLLCRSMATFMLLTAGELYTLSPCRDLTQRTWGNWNGAFLGYR